MAEITYALYNFDDITNFFLPLFPRVKIQLQQEPHLKMI